MPRWTLPAAPQNRLMHAPSRMPARVEGIHKQPRENGRTEREMEMERELMFMYRDWGGYLTFNSTHAPIKSGSGNTSYQISFAHGDSDACPANVQRSTYVATLSLSITLILLQSVFTFQCDVRMAGVLTFVPESSDQCTAVFTWAGRAGCPVCQDQDYTTLVCHHHCCNIHHLWAGDGMGGGMRQDETR